MEDITMPCVPTGAELIKASNEKGESIMLEAKEIAESANAYVDIASSIDDQGNPIFTIDASRVKNARLLLVDDSELVFINAKNGSEGNIIVVQGPNAPWLLRLREAPYIGNDGGGVITLSAFENAIDVISYTYDGSKFYMTYQTNWTKQGG